MEVRLAAHRGINCATKEDIDLGQDRIFLDGQVVGYVGRGANSPICLIFPNLTEIEEKAIEDAVRAKYGDTPRQTGRPVPIPDDDEEDYDDQDTP